MSQDNLRLFLDALAKDQALQAGLAALPTGQPDRKLDDSELEAVWVTEIIPFANSRGFKFSLEDVHQYQALQSGPRKIADEELDVVVGGDKCLCLIGGYGAGTGMDPSCWCPFVGWGSESDSELRCSCSGYGFGTEAQNG